MTHHLNHVTCGDEVLQAFVGMCLNSHTRHLYGGDVSFRLKVMISLMPMSRRG